MEKNGAITPQTPDVEHKIEPGVKAAGETQQIRALDDDTTKRLADGVEQKLVKNRCGA
jgi:hypothetical protein